MATCKDCIHEKVCFALIEKGLPWADGKYPAELFCSHFKNKADIRKVTRCENCKYKEICSIYTLKATKQSWCIAVTEKGEIHNG